MQADFLLDSNVDSKINLDEIRNTWLDSAEKSRAYTFDTSMVSGPPSGISLSPPSETQKAIWETVSGGVVTILYDIGTVEAYPEDYQEEGALERANHEMTAATETAAWGIDFSPDFFTHQLRFVAVPKEGVSAEELLKKFDAIKVAIEKLEDFENPKSLMEQSLLEQFKKTKATIVEAEQRNGKTIKAHLLVEGEYKFDIVGLINKYFEK